MCVPVLGRLAVFVCEGVVVWLPVVVCDGVEPCEAVVLWEGVVPREGVLLCDGVEACDGALGCEGALGFDSVLCWPSANTGTAIISRSIPDLRSTKAVFEIRFIEASWPIQAFRRSGGKTLPP